MAEGNRRPLLLFVIRGNWHDTLTLRMWRSTPSPATGNRCDVYTGLPFQLQPNGFFWQVGKALELQQKNVSGENTGTAEQTKNKIASYFLPSPSLFLSSTPSLSPPPIPSLSRVPPCIPLLVRWSLAADVVVQVTVTLLQQDNRTSQRHPGQENGTPPTTRKWGRILSCDWPLGPGQ